MRVTFRPLDRRDAELLKCPPPNPNARRWGLPRGSVVTINGRIVLAFDPQGQLFFQDGSDAIADLIRARMKVLDALETLSPADLARLNAAPV